MYMQDMDVILEHLLYKYNNSVRIENIVLDCATNTNLESLFYEKLKPLLDFLYFPWEEKYRVLARSFVPLLRPP